MQMALNRRVRKITEFLETLFLKFFYATKIKNNLDIVSSKKRIETDNQTFDFESEGRFSPP